MHGVRKHSYTNGGKEVYAKFKFEKAFRQRPLSGGSVFITGLSSCEVGLQARLYGSAFIVIARVKTSTAFCSLLFLES